MIMEITKKTTMGEMLDYDRGIAYVLMQSGMHCVAARPPSTNPSRTHVPSTASTSTRFSLQFRSTSTAKRRNSPQTEKRTAAAVLFL